MDQKSTETLELPLILERLSGFASFSASKELGSTLHPSAEYERVLRLQKETSEARYLLSINSALTVGGAHDVRTQADAAQRGAVLDPVDYLDIKSTLISARNLKRALETSSSQTPLLAEQAEHIHIVPGLVDAISKVLDDRGKVQDSASTKLSSIRRDLRIAKDRLSSKLQAMISDPKIIPMLQEPIVTQRDGRFVIPLRAEFKGRIEAVIHDRSSSGATLFIEPITVVNLNNQVRELELAERDEIRRILAELGSLVGDRADEIKETVEALATLDLTFAKAKYAESIQANEPILAAWNQGIPAHHPNSTLRLISARHPLLDPEGVVAIDLILDQEIFALVITGPNTGGKTVALKTTGLLVLMTQCGLHIPAESGSELSVFDGVYADIGDEQSIEQSLSTFSSHISNIIRIQSLASPRSLVLLDELGAGTDPQEGAALAKAILSQFLEQRITTIVATHFPEMKTFAHITSGVRNASVEFNLESLRPTYHLTIGLPGRSNALAIAERLGLGMAIVEKAKETLSPEDLRAESLLDEIHRQRDTTRGELQEARIANEEAEGLREDLRKKLGQIEQERRQILENARLEGEARIEQLQEEILELRRRLARAGQPLEVLEHISTEAVTLEGEFKEPIAVTKVDDASIVSELRLGDRVHIRSIDTIGVITELGAENAEVQVGRLRIRAKIDELAHPGEAEAQGGKVSSDLRKGVRITDLSFDAPPLELDIRGRTIEGALEELEKRLDAAFLAGMPFVRIIHGKGTGKLRQAVRQELKNNAYVSSFEPGHQSEGGDGVTRVKLATS